MKQYLLFDLDGTLTDSKPGITASVQYALKAFGIEEPDPDKLESFIGPPLMYSFQEFYHMDEEQAKAAVNKYRERFAVKGLYENEVYKGIPRMLRTLQKKGVHMAVASSKTTVYVERILEYFHISQYFEVVMGSEMDGTRAEKGEVVQEALSRLFQGGKIQRDRVYMIGDRRFDVEGAKACQIESVGVAYGYGSMEELKEAHADYIVRSVEELERFLLRDDTDTVVRFSGFQKVWAVLYPLMLFQLVRIFTQYVAYGALFRIRDMLPESLVFRDEAGVVAGYSGNVSVAVSAAGFLAAAAAIGGTARYVIGKAAQENRLLHLKREPGSNYLLAAGLTLGFTAGLNLLFHLTGFTNISASYQTVAQDQYAADFAVGLICYGFISAFCEELLFRGILYNYLRRFFQVKAAFLISAALFSLYHMNAVQGVYAFLMGLLLAYAYEFFGDFRIPVLIHMAANIAAYLLTYGGAALPWLLSWPVCLFMLALGGVSLYLLARQKCVL